MKKSNNFEKQIFREIPSQIPVHTVKTSYVHMQEHCVTGDTGGLFPVWVCARTGATPLARMVKMHIKDRTTGQRIDYAPVVTLYCSSCDPVPNTHGGDEIFSDEIQTLAV